LIYDYKINVKGSFNLKQFDKVLIIGLGKLGLPIARYVKEKGFDTYGLDSNPKAVEMARNAAIEKAVNFSQFDVFIICVSTHKPDDMFSPQIDGLLSIVEKISKEAKNGALVSIESTIPKGTSKKVFEMLNHRLHVAHAPHRWYALEQEEHGVNQLRVLGGVCQCCLDVAMEFYDGRVRINGEIKGQAYGIEIESEKKGNLDNNNNNKDKENGENNNYIVIDEEEQLQQQHNTVNPHKKSLDIRMHAVPQIEIAEITKIAENAHRYLQIAFAEDLYLYCQANNINFAELRDALNTKWNVNILEPRDGIGGHCLPKDTKMFLQSSKSIRSKILASAIEVDEDYRRYRQQKNMVLQPNQALFSRKGYDDNNIGET